MIRSDHFPLQIKDNCQPKAVKNVVVPNGYTFILPIHIEPINQTHIELIFSTEFVLLFRHLAKIIKFSIYQY